jgi:hypothetical protein
MPADDWLIPVDQTIHEKEEGLHRALPFKKKTQYILWKTFSLEVYELSVPSEILRKHGVPPGHPYKFLFALSDSRTRYRLILGFTNRENPGQ